MSIRLKIIALITAIFLGLTVTVFVFTRWHVESAFNAFELSNMDRMSQIALDGYSREMDSLVGYAKEVARSSEIQDYIENDAQADPSSFLQTLDILNQPASFFAISNDKGELLLARQLDTEKELLTDPDSSLMEFIRQDNRLRSHYNTSSVAKGVIVIQKVPYMIVSVPILPAEAGGLIRGAIMLAQKWENSTFFQVAHKNGMSLFEQQPGTPLTRDMQAFYNATNQQVDARETKLFGTMGIGTYVTLADIYDAPGLIVRLTKQKQAGTAARACALKIITGTTVTGGLLFLISIVLVEVTIQNRLRKLVNQVKELKSIDRLSEAEISVRGRDEIGKIAHGLRYILDSMKANRYRWMRSEKRLQEVLEFAPMGTILANPENLKLYRVNDAVIETIGYSKRELKGKGLNDIFTRIGGKDDFNGLDQSPEQAIQKMGGVIRCRDGRQLPVNARVGRVKQGDHEFLLIAFTPDKTACVDGEAES